MILFSSLSTTNVSLGVTINQEPVFNQIEWSSTGLISNVSSLTSINPSTTIDSEDNVYVVWEDFTDYNGAGTDSDIFLRKFDGITESWGEIVLISTGSDLQSFNPSIVVDNEDNLHVIWYDYFFNVIMLVNHVYYKKYNATTQSWSNITEISTESSNDQISNNPAIAIDNENNVHVVWQDSNDYSGSGIDSDIFYKVYNASTQSWNSTSVISTESTSSSGFPEIIIDNKENINVVWVDVTNYNSSGTDADIFYKNYIATTSSWSNTIVLSTESTDFSNLPSIDVDSNDNLHVVWEDYTDYNSAGTDIDIFYKYFNSISQVWSASIIVSSTSESDSNKANIALDQYDNLHVVWEDNTNYNSAGTDIDVFYRTFNYTLQIWTSPNVLSTTSSDSNSPIIVTDNKNNLHVAWQETDLSIGTEKNIFYKTGIIIPETPVLNRLSSVDNLKVDIDWNDVKYADQYKLFRKNEPIYNISNLVPLASIITTNYTDVLDSNFTGYYFYVIVASNSKFDSDASNIVHVEIKPEVSSINTETEIKTNSVIKTISETKTITEDITDLFEELSNNDLFIPIIAGSSLALFIFIILLRKKRNKNK